MNLLRSKTNNLRQVLKYKYKCSAFRCVISVSGIPVLSVPVKIVLGPNRLSSGTGIRHCMGSVKSLQAQYRSSQKKTVSTGVCQNFLAFRNRGVVESHALSHFESHRLSHFSEDSLMDVVYCSRTVFGEGKTSSGIFQFSGFRLKDTMRDIAKKRVGRSRQNPMEWI